MGHTSFIFTPSIFPPKKADKTLHSNTKTIAEVFVGERNSSSFRKKYIIQGEKRTNITFYESDTIGVNPRENDPLVITMQHGN